MELIHCEKLVVGQLVKKFPVFCGAQKMRFMMKLGKKCKGKRKVVPVL
jgi:hypothetical protein